ncbi:MAG: discoidin domain-containing protein [Candidatus Omnitrophota bacterium]|nr:discoidin domain-containing protein [Candidatus Omnitrophota bacterium]
MEKHLRRLGFVFCLGLLFLSFFAHGSNNVFAADLSLDDFDGNKIVAKWWMSDPTAPYVYTIDFANTEQVHQGTKSMKVIFNKANDSNAYSLFAAKGYFDLKDFDYLSFWVYNNGSGLNFNIRFEDAAGGAMELNWAGMDFPATVTTAADWENLTIDLSRLTYSTDLDWSAVTQIIFMVAPGNTTASGTFWMDDLKLSRAPNSAPLDAFEADNFSWYGGGVFGNNLSIVSSEFHNDGTNLGNHSMRVTWGTKANGTWDSFDYLPDEVTAHDLNRIGNYPNFTLNGNYLFEAWVKSTTDNNFQILLKFMTGPSAGEDIGYQTYTGAGGWQKLVWNYSGKASASDVYQVKFMAYPGAADDGGTLYMDDVNLTGGTAPATPNPPGGFTSDAADPDLDGNYTISWNAVSGATNYQLQEANNENFTNATNFYPTGTSQGITKNPNTQKGKYQYRVRTNLSGNYGSYTAPIIITVGTSPETPTLTVPSTDNNGNYLVEWTDVSSSGATVYELLESTSADFSTALKTMWPTLPQERMFNYTNGTYYYKVRAWTAVPEQGGLSSNWSNVASCAVTMMATRPNTPALNQPTDADSDGIFKLIWSDETASGATRYETWESPNSDFSAPISFFWPVSNYVWIDKAANGTYYYKVRSWTALPENDGIYSDWSVVKSIAINLATVSMTYDDLKTAAYNLAQSAFLPPMAQPIKLDTFEQNSLTGSPSGLRWTDLDGGTVYQYIVSSNPAVKNYSMKITYTKTALYQYLVGNIDNSNYSDFTRHSRITFSTYGQVPILVELEDNLGRRKQVGTQTPGTPNSKGWSGVGLDYDSLRGLSDFDLTNVKKILFCIAPGNATASGVIYFDMIFQDTPVPQLDWPADSVPQNTGLVYQEANKITGSQVIDDGVWWAVLRPRAARVYEIIDEVYVYKGSLGAYVRKGYDFNDFNYADPSIIPAIDFNAPDMQATWKWKYLVQFQLGHKYTLNGNDLFPEVYMIVGSAYQKLYGYPPIMGGASFRPLLHSFDSTLGEESFPRLNKVYIKKIDANKVNLLCLVDSESVTAAMSIDIIPGQEAAMDVTSTAYTRRAIDVADDVGVAGFSSMYFLGEESSDGLEAHDSDDLIVSYVDGFSTEYRIPQHYAPEGVEEIYETYFDPRTGININRYALENQDQWAGHYMPWIEANYDRRSSYSVDITSSSTPFKVRLWQHSTFNEYDDNVVASFVPVNNLPKSTSVAGGLTTDYTMKSFFPTIVLEDVDNNDLSPRDTTLTWTDPNGTIYSISSSTAQAHSGIYSKSINYAKTSAEQAFYARIDPLNQIRKGDFSESNTLVLWTYGNIGELKVDFEDVNGVRKTIGTVLVDSALNWKKLEINYNFLRNETFNLSNVSKIWFCPNPTIPNASGYFYIDDISITTIDTFPGTPFLYELGVVNASGKYEIKWPKCGGAGIDLEIPIGGSTQGLYEIQEAADPNFTNPTSYWPTASPLSVTKTTNGTYYYRGRSWTAAPEDNGLSSPWSNVVDMLVDMSYPTFEDFDGISRVDLWWDVDGTTVYQRSVDSTIYHDGAKSMKVNYNKNGLPWSYFAAKPVQNGYSNNFSGASYFTFWVYGNVSLLVKVEDNQGGFWEQNVSTQTPSTTDWEQMTVNLWQATGVNLGNIKNVIFFVAPGDAYATGTLNIDEIKLTLTNDGTPPTAVASSSENASLTPDKAIDSNMTTRWSSNFTDNEWIYIDLGVNRNFDTVELSWETGYAASYEIQISNDATNWTTVYSTTTGDGGVDTVYVGNQIARYVKMKGNLRATQWGYSLWEFKIMKAYASSIEGTGYEPNKAVDGNTSTRWSSAFTDNEWIYLDYMWARQFNTVTLNWEASYASAYEIQISSDSINWTTVYSTTTGDGGIDTINVGAQTARYIKMKGVTRATQWGYSLWEFKN